ncbi:MAG: DUF799 domain-containing protein [Azoarcus sp.]|jgi:hypothetical protein|nr:DUF799 domain-containing protein [Azoarcus sp.]
MISRTSLFPALRVSAMRLAMVAGASFLLAACVTPPSPMDYTAFRANRPRSILVLPPVNRSPEIKAPTSILATATVPLGEGGYYVIPVTLSEETFKQNGVTVADEAQALPLDKLREIFGADAALYISIDRFGVSYRLLDSVVEASASARLVDLRSGEELWQGYAYVSTGQNNNNSGGGLVGMLVRAAIKQIVNSLTDRSHEIGRAASYQLLSAGRFNGLLYGPYHPNFGTD